MLGQSRRVRACRRSSRSATRARSPPSGTARSSWSTIRARPTPRSTMRLPLIQLNPPQADVPGHPSVAGAHCSLDSLELAVGLARPARPSAVVTGPVAKEQLYAIGFQHPGQTEFVAERCGVSPGNVVMMLAGPTLRTVPVTTHLPLRDVAATAHQRADRIARPGGAARAAAQFRDRRAAARGRRASTRMPAKAASSAARRSRSSSRRSPRSPPKAGG